MIRIQFLTALGPNLQSPGVSTDEIGCEEVFKRQHNNQDNNGVQTHTQTLYTYQYVMDSQITDGGLSCIVSHQGPSQD